ncbi:ThiF family adenylyltransferase [bacterium]|nr:ThiF family adenylyltransferase [bacterium]
MADHRYQRQTLFDAFGEGGQERLRASSVAIVGAGALGTHLAEQLARAGVGRLRVIDRDVVEWSNLHRQSLFIEQDARDKAPKAVAVRRHLALINTDVEVDARVADLTPRNAHELLSGVDAILDGTDNVETRYLLNDFTTMHALPWIYGGAVGATAVAAGFAPSEDDGPCLRCVFPYPPPPGELPTCDTTGVLPPTPALAASLQVAIFLRYLSDVAMPRQLTQIDLWTGRTASVAMKKRAGCVCCEGRRFEYLDARASSWTTSLCGRNAVQVHPPEGFAFDLESVKARLAKAGRVVDRHFYVEFTEGAAAQGESADSGSDSPTLLIFRDGRTLIQGTTDEARARALAARWVGF